MWNYQGRTEVVAGVKVDFITCSLCTALELLDVVFIVFELI